MSADRMPEKLALLDATASDNLDVAAKHFRNASFETVMEGLQCAIKSKSSKCMRYLLEHGIKALKADSSSKKSDESLRSFIETVTSAVCTATPEEGENTTTEESEKKEDAKKVDPIANVEGALQDIRDGRFVVVQDAASRENEGDLIIASEKVTPEKMAFMVNYTSGIICVGIEEERCGELELPQMVAKNTESHGTAFTVSIDFKHGTTTGISAEDRAKTILAMVSKKTQPSDFARPGHIFPLRARKGGVLTRPGHTETSVDLPKLAGLYPSGVMSEIVNRDGTMARTPELRRFAATFGLRMVTIEEIIEYRKAKNV
eukprot:CAMPEP_0185266228 /NCGR_PEP_ID=MMETSP1359-20130426/30398_1 /TAXON_ID=552665 /ORGANISM="Bigelowiella longifila, Strain CCMP242" /LENGTH=316 /DNA_ID=CAMNT_0027855939 /DNA_START=23 /DNA_END=973 /DNA_ORIENTATION=-